MLCKISYWPDHEHFMTTILPIDFHKPSTVTHRPANVPAHGVKEILFRFYLDLADSFTSVLKTLYFYHDGKASHSAQVFITRAADRDWYNFPVAVIFFSLKGLWVSLSLSKYPGLNEVG